MEINKEINEYIENLYSYYAGYGISKKEFYNLILKSTNILNEERPISSFKEKLSDQINSLIIPIIESKFENHQESIKIINNFINNNFVDSFSYENSCKSIANLNNYLNKFDLTINPDIIVSLLDNAKLYKALEIIFDKNKKSIVFGKNDQLFNNNTLNSLLEVYCDINDIEVKHYYDPDDNSLSFSEESVDIYLKEIGKLPILNK